MTTDPIGPATILLDDLLCSLSDEQASALRAALPDAWIDQAEAAARDARTHARAIPGAICADAPVSRSPQWLRLGAFETLLAWAADRGRTCMHSPDARRPEPVFAAAWKPRLVVCSNCRDLLRLPRNLDSLCDCCGRDCRQSDGLGLISPIAMVYGELFYHAGVCNDCHPRWTD